MRVGLTIIFILTISINLFATDLKTDLEAACKLVHQKQYEQAIPKLTELVENSNGDIKAMSLFNLAYISKKKRNYADALRYYSKAVNHYEDEKLKAHAYRNIANLYKLMGRVEEAHYFYNHVLRLDIDKKLRMQTLFSKAKNAKGLGRFDIFVEELKKSESLALSLEDSTYLAKIYNQFGYRYAENGDFDKALDYYLKSLEYKELGTTYHRFAEMSLLEGDTIGAISEYKHALSLESASDRFLTYKDLADLFVLLDEHKEAKKYLEYAYSLYPKVSQTKANVEVFKQLYHYTHDTKLLEKGFDEMGIVAHNSEYFLKYYQANYALKFFALEQKDKELRAFEERAKIMWPVWAVSFLLGLAVVITLFKAARRFVVSKLSNLTNTFKKRKKA
ncbi:MAG: tetratricopeptide repeat protein [Bacteroidota bacterium]